MNKVSYFARGNFIDTMKELSDKEYQKRWIWLPCFSSFWDKIKNWGKKYPELSFSDRISEILEDFEYLNYFEKPVGYIWYTLFNEEEYEAMRHFCSLFLNNIEKIGIGKQDKVYMNAPEWDEIILEAQKAMKVLQKMEDLTRDDMYWLGSRDFLKESIQKYINPEFKSLDEFKREDLPDMIIGFLKAYGAGKFGYKMLYDLGDVMYRYSGFYFPFYDEEEMEKFPYWMLWHDVLCEMYGLRNFIMLPEDADFFIKILQDQTKTPEELESIRLDYVCKKNGEEGREERAKREVGYDREYMG